MFFLCTGNKMPEMMIASYEVDYNEALREIYEAHEHKAHKQATGRSTLRAGQVMHNVFKQNDDPVHLKKMYDDKCKELGHVKEQLDLMKVSNANAADDAEIKALRA